MDCMSNVYSKYKTPLAVKNDSFWVKDLSNKLLDKLSFLFHKWLKVGQINFKYYLWNQA
jgi:hypothetical protein